MASIRMYCQKVCCYTEVITITVYYGQQFQVKAVEKRSLYWHYDFELIERQFFKKEFKIWNIEIMLWLLCL